MKRELFDIWEDTDDTGPFPWRVQMVNYVAQLRSRPAAESFVESTKKARVLAAKDAVATAFPTRKSK